MQCVVLFFFAQRIECVFNYNAEPAVVASFIIHSGLEEVLR
jgi:hypothetical protein